MRSDHQAGRSRGRRGQTPIVPGTRRRLRHGRISVITDRGRPAWTVFEGRFTAPVLLSLSSRPDRHARREAPLMFDNHTVHPSPPVNRPAISHCRRIRLFFPPGHGSELKPDGLLNQEVKENAVGRGHPRNKVQPAENVRRFLQGHSAESRESPKSFPRPVSQVVRRDGLSNIFRSPR